MYSVRRYYNKRSGCTFEVSYVLCVVRVMSGFVTEAPKRRSRKVRPIKSSENLRAKAPVHALSRRVAAVAAQHALPSPELFPISARWTAI